MKDESTSLLILLQDIKGYREEATKTLEKIETTMSSGPRSNDEILTSSYDSQSELKRLGK